MGTNFFSNKNRKVIHDFWNAISSGFGGFISSGSWYVYGYGLRRSSVVFVKFVNLIKHTHVR